MFSITPRGKQPLIRLVQWHIRIIYRKKDCN